MASKEEQAKLDDRISAIKDAENKELGILLESKVGGIDEFNDWSEQGLRSFREKILPIIREHCQELKKGNSGILHKYLDEKTAACQARVAMILNEIEANFEIEPIVPDSYFIKRDNWFALKEREGVEGEQRE